MAAGYDTVLCYSTISLALTRFVMPICGSHNKLPLAPSAGSCSLQETVLFSPHFN